MVHLCAPMTAGAQTVKAVSEDIQAELAYLLSFVGPQEGERSRFDPEQIRHLLAFVATPKDNGIVYHAGKLNGGPSAYHDFSIQKKLQEILHIAYDPDIPAVMTSPSSLRLTRWKEVEGTSQPLPRFWEKISDLQSPLIVTGVEYTVNTPDVHSGT